MTKQLTEAQLAILNSSYPVSEDSSTRLILPRFGILSKDIVETTGTGKNKKVKIIEAAGTFYTERDLGETNEEGKKVWTKEFIAGETVDVTIVYHRRQLRKYDDSLGKFISSPIFDNATQPICLFLDKQIIKRGTQAELQACYPALTTKGKPTSDLKEETILYVVYKGEMYQMNISQSSKWEFKSYAKTCNPSAVVTTLGSIEDTFGSNTFRKLTFKNKRPIDADEFDTVVESQTKVKEVVASDEQYFLGGGADAKADAKMEALAEGK